MDPKNQNLELINAAIQKLMEEIKNRETSSPSFIGEDEDDQLLLSRLLSQLESLKGDRALKQPKALNELREEICMAAEEEIKSETDIDKEEIVKELKEVKKQNSVTHWLLSIMIVLTVVWQISEVSLILKLKDGLNHPFKLLGGMFTGFFKAPGTTNGQEEEKNNHIESSSLPSLKIPELPHVELPDFSANGEDH